MEQGEKYTMRCQTLKGKVDRANNHSRGCPIHLRILVVGLSARCVTPLTLK